jgi:hypothetical protein
MTEQYNGYVFRWNKAANGEPGFYCESTFKTTLSECWTDILKTWCPDPSNKKLRKNAMQLIRRRGGEVVKIKFQRVNGLG